MNTIKNNFYQKHKLLDIIHWGENLLVSNGFKNVRQEIEWMLCDLLKIDRSDIYLKINSKISKRNFLKLKEWINQRLKNKPLQYITGKTEFYGHQISVSPDVLIPRPETERLVDIAIDTIKNLSKPKILEVGTGSGCISIALGSAKKDANILSLDVSDSALEIAKINTKKNNISNIKFLKLDFLESIPKGQYDLIISNPPYISKNEMKEIMLDVKEFEPKIALTDNNDGLEFYRRFSNKAKKMINEKGSLILEVGIGSHPIRVREIFHSSGFNKIDLISDYNGDPRVIKIEV
ncbi:MAG: peptide chain release factor N(5)-glutamine methyltransferase [Candidatus Neomarinimicrobiota bacterium]|nr:peptide chain release factor N(5)-glutamine methyltransferase [Candidatus Neomarinimicrobiota bacterium]